LLGKVISFNNRQRRRHGGAFVWPLGRSHAAPFAKEASGRRMKGCLEELTKGGKTIPSTISFQELEFFPEDIIDSGNFGSVYFGKVRELPAAIKVLKETKMTPESMETFIREVEIVKYAPYSSLLLFYHDLIFLSLTRNNSHPNIVRYLGVCAEPGKFVIVMEYIPGGNLHQLLADKKRVISTFQLMKIAKEVALGMNWLHGAKPPIIHRDLKLNNVLLEADLTAKICDFGLSVSTHLLSLCRVP
jgi:serine/threonine protein kinase